MKPSLLLLTIVACFALFSCQKEIDWSTNPTGGTGGGGTGGGGTGGGSGSGLLWKVATKTGPTDSANTEYTYNSANKLIRFDLKAVTSVGSVISYQKYYRNAAGNIYRMVQNAGFSGIVFPPGIFPDSIVTEYGYSSAGKLLWGKFEISMLGIFTQKDSAVLTLDAQDRIIKAVHYQTDPLMGVYSLFGKSEYVYASSGNLISEKVYEYDETTSTYDLTTTTTYEYDSKVNPQSVSNWDAHIMNEPGAASPNNAIKETFVDHADAANNRTTTIVYTYNAANKPVSGTLTTTGQPVSTSIITYK